MLHSGHMAKTKVGYIDGFVFIAKKKDIAAYKKMATLGKKVWMKHGALDYKECMGNDLKVKSQGGMKPLSFPAIAKVKAGETVWFSYIGFKSRAHRDMVNAKVMKDFAKNYADMGSEPMPMDPRRMAYGGFTVEVGS
jgi:uncharacterized protein YbaA (DUF1428 family)